MIVALLLKSLKLSLNFDTFFFECIPKSVQIFENDLDQKVSKIKKCPKSKSVQNQ